MGEIDGRKGINMMTIIFAVSAIVFALFVVVEVREFLGLSWSGLWALALTLFLTWGVLPGGETLLLIILAILLVILVIVAIQRKPVQKSG